MIGAGAVTPDLDVLSMPLGAIAPTLPLNLLQSLGVTRSESLYREILPWLVALVVVAVLGCAVLLVIRRLFQRESTQSLPFTLDDLRAMHRRGQLTDVEFERAKDTMLGGARAMAKRERVRLAEAERARRRAGSARDARNGAEGENSADGPSAERGDGGETGSA